MKRIEKYVTKCHLNWPAFVAIALLLVLWQCLSVSGIVPNYMLPSPFEVYIALICDAELLCHNAFITFSEAFLGLSIGVFFGFVLAIVMDEAKIIKRALQPLITISQTVPTIAIAPLLVLWLGYGMLPKIVLVALTTFFPITISLLSGFLAVKPEEINLMKTFGASKLQIFRWVKLPNAREAFFSGLKISVTYAVVGAVIAEWLGGFDGLGVAMMRMRKSYAYADMFATIIVISALSLTCIGVVSALEYMSAPWKRKK